MLSYTNIVVGTDGSATSLKAVRTAASLARVYAARLTIVSAYHGDGHSLLDARQTDVSALPVVSETRAREYLEEASRIARDEGAADIQLRARSGTAVQILTEAVGETAANLIVIGNKGVNTITGRVFGNIPTEVARRADVDVMLVNTREPRS
ncbi:Universal stress protein [Corynebacterium guangdongense]|nr:universal stress protein [Corynebacterium guangdongense]WJZ17809.1 Universal stress protein [Corynebacterium guangdongense]